MVSVPSSLSDAPSNKAPSIAGSDSDSEVDDNEPPLLKYTRITSLPKNFFLRDSISFCCFTDDYFAFGTHSGILHITSPDYSTVSTIKCHKSSILSIDIQDDYFVTGSIDGTVIIGHIHDSQNISQYNFKRPIYSVALINDYKNNKFFISGGMAGDVILSQKNWLGNRLDTILNTDEKKYDTINNGNNNSNILTDNDNNNNGNIQRGPIMGVYSMQGIVFWMNDKGITFFDIPSKSMLLNIPFPNKIKDIDALKDLQYPLLNENDDLRPDLFRPHAHLAESNRIIIAWGPHVWIIKISLLNNNNNNNNNNSNKLKNKIKLKNISNSSINNDNSTTNSTPNSIIKSNSLGFNTPSPTQSQKKSSPFSLQKNNTTNFGALISSAASTFKTTIDRSVEIEYHFTLQMLISGIASFKDDQLICLGFPIDNDQKLQNNKNSNNTDIDTSNDTTVHTDITSFSKYMIPELKIINSFNGEEIYTDKIVTKNYEKLSLNDYHLGKYIFNSNPKYSLISSSDSIEIQEFSLLDHYHWYLQKDHLLDAWKIGKYLLNSIDRFNLGLKFLNQLISKDDWNQIILYFDIIFTEAWTADINTNKNIATNNEKEKEDTNETNIDKPDDQFTNIILQQWSDFIKLFITSNHIDLIAHQIPQDPILDPSTYDSALQYYLDNNMIDKFNIYIHKWPIDIFSASYFEEELEIIIERNQKPTNPETDSKSIGFLQRDAIIYLYTQQNKHNKAIPHLIAIKDIRAIDIILSKQQLSQHLDQIENIILIPYNGDIKDITNLSIPNIEAIFQKPIELLVESRYTVSISQTIQIFNELPNGLQVILFCYLRELMKIDPFIVTPFENDLIRLYCEFDQTHLLQFLQTKNNYDVEKAIQLCTLQKGLSNELIYLWGKVGETKKALSLIIDELKDPTLAIKFVRHWGDSELQRFMIEYSMNKPRFVKALLESCDEASDVYLEVLRRMSDELEVQGLKNILVDILKEDTLGLSVKFNILKIVENDSDGCAAEFLRVRSMGKVFDTEV